MAKRTRDGEDKASVDAAVADANATLELRCSGRVRCVAIEGRGRGLVATRAVNKGDVIAVEKPLAATQAMGNRSSVLACAHCLAPAGTDVARHVALATGAVPRRTLVAAEAERDARGSATTRAIATTLPTLPTLPSDDASTGASEGPTPCARAAGGCADVFCSARCRDAASGWHALLCRGGCEEGSPTYEFHEHARRTNESFLLAADAMARALAAAGASDGVGEGEAEGPGVDDGGGRGSGRGCAANANAAANWRALSSMHTQDAPWWVSAARAASLGEDASKRPHKRRSVARRLREQLEDAWRLLEMSWARARGIGRDGSSTPAHVASLLTFDAFARLVAAVDDGVCALSAEHPGCAYARKAAAAEAEVAEAACAALDAATKDVAAAAAAAAAAGEARANDGNWSDDEDEDD